MVISNLTQGLKADRIENIQVEFGFPPLSLRRLTRSRQRSYISPGFDQSWMHAMPKTRFLKKIMYLSKILTQKPGFLCCRDLYFTAFSSTGILRDLYFTAFSSTGKMPVPQRINYYIVLNKQDACSKQSESDRINLAKPPTNTTTKPPSTQPQHHRYHQYALPNGG